MLDAAAAVDGSAAVVLSDNHHHHHFHQQQNYYGSNYSQQQLTRLQDEILQCLDTLERETLLFEDDEFGGTVTSTTGASDSVSNCRGVNDKKNPMISEQQQRRRQQLVQRFLCPLFDQLLKFCRFVCPPLPSTTPTMNTSVNTGDRQQLTNGSGVATVDHFHHHNKVHIKH